MAASEACREGIQGAAGDPGQGTRGMEDQLREADRHTEQEGDGDAHTGQEGQSTGGTGKDPDTLSFQ